MAVALAAIIGLARFRQIDPIVEFVVYAANERGQAAIAQELHLDGEKTFDFEASANQPKLYVAPHGGQDLGYFYLALALVQNIRQMWRAQGEIAFVASLGPSLEAKNQIVPD
jgi:hypothetical protein